MTDFGNRIIVLIDMDCFFCQVEAKLNPTLKGKAMAVVQYSTFGPGATIAVSYEARAFGVTKHMRGDEARKKCPHIELVTVPPSRNKPDTSRYRNAGKQVVEVLAKYCNVVEKASVDEAYLDITDLVEKRLESMTEFALDELKNKLTSSFVVGYCDNDSNDEDKRREGVERWVNEAFDELGDLQSRKLAIAAVIVEEFRAAVYEQCEYRCSAGISYNKILAKLACGLHKPNKQTILPVAEVPTLYSLLPVKKVRNLGGKFGNIVMESLGCNVMADLLRFSLQDLQKRFDEKTGSWLYNIARGIDNEPVQARLVGKSIGSTKNFPGKQAITKLETLEYWINELTTEIIERLEQDLEENQRRAMSLTISYQFVQDRRIIGQSRVCPLSSYKHERIAKMCLNIITKATQKPIAFIGLSASKFAPAKDVGTFINFFKPGTSKSNDTGSIIESEHSKGSEDQKETVTDYKNGSDEIVTMPTKEITTECNVKPDKSKHENEKSGEKTCEQNVRATKKPRSLIIDTDLCKKLDGEDFKNSFFMNFLKESKGAVGGAEPEKKPINEETKGSNHGIVYKINDEAIENMATESPDLFEDTELPEGTKEEQETKQNTENVVKNTETNINGKTNALEKLQEIFPNLDDLDMSIVQLLPIELQRAANVYLKSKKVVESTATTKNATKTSPTKSKSTRIKRTTSGKSKNTSNNFMNNFFVKQSSSTSDSTSTKRCPECNQMIKTEKFAEHADFHIAQNLQRVINQSLITETRNSNEIGKSHTPTKRKMSPECAKSNKKSRNIQSFFT